MKTFWHAVRDELKKRIPVPLVWGRERAAQETPENVIFVDFVRGKQMPITPNATLRTTVTKAFTDDLPFIIGINARSNRAGATSDDHEELALNIMAELMIVIRAVAHAKFRTDIKSAAWGFEFEADPGSTSASATINMIVTLKGTLLETASSTADGLVAAIRTAIVDQNGNELEVAVDQTA